MLQNAINAVAIMIGSATYAKRGGVNFYFFFLMKPPPTESYPLPHPPPLPTPGKGPRAGPPQLPRRDGRQGRGEVPLDPLVAPPPLPRRKAAASPLLRAGLLAVDEEIEAHL